MPKRTLFTVVVVNSGHKTIKVGELHYEGLELINAKEAVAAVLSHYAGYIRSCAKMDGQINTDMQEHIVGRLIESLLKFRFDR